MLASVVPLLILASKAVLAAGQSTTTLCVAGQCLEGTSNISIGAVVSATSSDHQFVLLPGTYAATTNPENLKLSLANPSSRLSYSQGFAPNTSTSAPQSIAFPLNIALQPGFLTTTASLYRGQTQFHSVPASGAAVNETRGATTQAGGSIVISADVWAAFTTTGSTNSRIVLWDSVADLAQLPSGAGQSALTLVDLQSTKCSPSCSGNGICTTEGKCVCPEGSGFTGSSCESCLDGFYGPQCLPCPEDCDKCDQGATGSGKCLVPKVTGAPSTCNCANGVCGPNGECQCNDGWEDGSSGTKCSKCKTGFFQTANGDCQVCGMGCERCQDNSGTCIQCGSGLTQDGNNPRKCTIDSTANQCPEGSFASGGSCAVCSDSCTTCTGAGSGACLRCASRTYKLDGVCVPTDQNGVCSGSKRVANNVKNTCDACPAGCAECGIPGFTPALPFDGNVKCTKCLPGTVLSEGKCIEACPSGTFISPDDGFTCVACDSSCATCAGDATFCLTCSGSGLAHEGTCGTSCPTGTFKDTGACLPCHADCASCSGAGFDQCTSCTTSRPVLQTAGTTQAGRCLPTCSKSQFFDASSNKCQACDGSCSSCSGAGPNQCLACSNAGQILQGGTCVDAKCERGSGVVPGLGTCLSTLVAAPFIDNTPVGSPSAPPSAPPASPSRRLEWWQILLMALGCAFIFMMFLMCWRRRMRKKRAAKTSKFAQNIQDRGVLARSMQWLGGKLFNRHSHHPRGEKAAPPPSSYAATDIEGMISRMRAEETERHQREMELLEARVRGASTGYSKWEWSSRAPSVRSHSESKRREERSLTASPQPLIPGHDSGSDAGRHPNRMSTGSFYSQITGAPRSSPEPRQPIRHHNNDDVPPLFTSNASHQQPGSRFSNSTIGTSLWRNGSQRGPAQQQPSYDMDSMPLRPHRTGDSFDSTHSGSSGTSSKGTNPFRR